MRCSTAAATHGLNKGEIFQSSASPLFLPFQGLPSLSVATSLPPVAHCACGTHRAHVLCMMCNLLGQREMALGNHIPALQLFKQAEQVSCPQPASVLYYVSKAARTNAMAQLHRVWQPTAGRSESGI